MLIKLFIVAIFCSCIILFYGTYFDSVCLNPIQTGGGGGEVLTLNAYNFFKIQPNAAKLYEFFLNGGSKMAAVLTS